MNTPVENAPNRTLRSPIDAAEDALNAAERGELDPATAVESARRDLALHREELNGGLSRALAPLLYLGVCTAVEIVFIEFYVRWHGARLLTLDLYSPENIDILSNITFVNGPTAMSIIAEVLMFSSLGVWANRSYDMVVRYSNQAVRPFYDIGVYAGLLIRSTAVAAIIVTLLKLSKFSIFGQSAESFEAVAGLSFLLGFFGDEAYNLIVKLRDKIFGSVK